MGDQQHRPFVVVQRLHQGAAAVDVEVVGRLVEDQQVRGLHGHQMQQQPRPLAARQVEGRGLHLVRRQAELGQSRAAARLGLFRQGAADHVQRRLFRVHGLDLVLVEPADPHPRLARQFAGHRRQRLGQQLGEGRLA